MKRKKNVAEMAADTAQFVKNTSFVIRNIKWIAIIVAVILGLLLVVFIIVGIYATIQSNFSTISAVQANIDPTAQIQFADTTGDTLSLQDVALSFLGVPYVFGAASTTSADCSGFILQTYSLAGTNVVLPHSADAMADYGSVIFDASYVGETMDKVAQTADTAGWYSTEDSPDPGVKTIYFPSDDGTLTTLLPGDLLFFNYGRSTTVGARIGHVAMYIGNGQFVHTSNEREDCCIKALYTVSDDGTVTWTSFAKSVIKITRVLDQESYISYQSDLTGSPITDITATDAYNLGSYLQTAKSSLPDEDKYSAAVAIINAARADHSNISTELAKVYSVSTAKAALTSETKRLVRMSIIGTYWDYVPAPTPTP